MRIGDTVKVTDEWGTVEGTVYKLGPLRNAIELTTAGRRQLCYYTDNELYSIERIRPTEPEDVASVYYDEQGNGWIKYSNIVPTNWINAKGIKRSWNNIEWKDES